MTHLSWCDGEHHPNEQCRKVLFHDPGDLDLFVAMVGTPGVSVMLDINGFLLATGQVIALNAALQEVLPVAILAWARDVNVDEDDVPAHMSFCPNKYHPGRDGICVLPLLNNEQTNLSLIGEPGIGISLGLNPVYICNEHTGQLQGPSELPLAHHQMESLAHFRILPNAIVSLEYSQTYELPTHPRPGDITWTGPVPVRRMTQLDGAAMLFHDVNGDVMQAGSYFVAWRAGLASWEAGEVMELLSDPLTWIWPIEEAAQFGGMLERLGIASTRYTDLTEPSRDKSRTFNLGTLTAIRAPGAGEPLFDWSGPQPLEEGRYPLPGGTLDGHEGWNSQRQGEHVGWLFWDRFGDLIGAGCCFVAVVPGITEWGNGQVLPVIRDRKRKAMIWTDTQAIAFGQGLIELHKAATQRESQLTQGE